MTITLKLLLEIKGNGNLKYGIARIKIFKIPIILNDKQIPYEDLQDYFDRECKEVTVDGKHEIILK